MKTVFVLFDSINRLMLEAYGCKILKTPNFSRLAKKAVTFDSHYIGSMPCAAIFSLYASLFNLYNGVICLNEVRHFMGSLLMIFSIMA